MNAQVPIGSKLVEELTALVGEHSARVKMNASLAGEFQREQEQVARVRFTEVERHAVAEKQHAERSARQKHEQLVLRIAEKRTADRARIEQSLREARAKLIIEANRIPGALADVSSDFAGAATRGDSRMCTVPPRALVVGEEAAPPDGERPVPVLLPLIGSRGLILRGAGAPARAFVEALFARLIATIPIASLRIAIFDPDMHGMLSGFSELRNTMGTAFPMPYLDNARLQAHLSELLNTVQANINRMTPVGASNLLDIWETAMPKPALNVLFVDDRPGAMDATTRSMLARIIESGPSRGVLTIVLQTDERALVDAPSWNEKTPEARDNELFSTRAMTELEFDVSSGHVSVPVDDGRFVATPIRALSHETIKPLVEAVQSASVNDSGPIVPAEHLLPRDGKASSAEGIEIALGQKENGDPLLVRLRTENPPLPNMLIGGDVGTGKSNLLHALNYAIAAKYPVEEVELMLLDFKSGTEFQRYAPGTGLDGTDRVDWLPNASLVGLESDREFGYRVLEHVSREVDRRGAEFKRIGMSGYDGFRKANGRMPRIVVLVDEFQTLFENDDEVSSESVRLLSSIMRKGRSFGVHMVLSTQTLSGIRALASQADAIFAQVPVRVALRLGRSESQVMLAQGNLAASRLRYRGEVVLNENRGEGEENNQYGVVTYAEPGFTARLQRSLWEEARPKRGPRLFRGTAFANRAHSASRGRALALGEIVDVPGTVVEHTFGADPNRTLAIVGVDESVKRELLRSSVFSGLSCGSYARVVFVGDYEGYFASGEVERATFKATRFETVPHAEAAQWLVSNQLWLHGGDILIVVAEAQRIRNLREEIRIEPTGGAAQAPSSTGHAQKVQAEPAVGLDAHAAVELEFDSLFGTGIGDEQRLSSAGAEIAPDPDILAEYGALSIDNSYISDSFVAADGQVGAASEALIGRPDQSAEHVLQTLARSNEVESDLVVSLQLFSQIDSLFGYDRDGGNGIGGYALAKVPLGEMRSMFGSRAEETDASPRFFYTRAGSAGNRMFAIPFGEVDHGEAL